MLGWFFNFLFKIFGWHLSEKELPDVDKAVLIFAHHTSNWDFPTMLAAKFAWNIQVRYLGKHTLFKPPFGWFFKSLGGIPVERSKANNTVDQVVDIINKEDRCLLALSPEGTRSYTDYWKTGFYQIARGANVPIIMFYLDTRTKTIGFSDPFQTTGDIEADFQHFAEYYKDFKGFKPEQASIVQTKETFLKNRQ